MAGKPTFTQSKGQRICDLLAKGKWQIEACKTVGISDRTLRRWRKADPEFAAEIEQSQKDGFMKMLHSAHSRLREAEGRDGILRADKELVHLEWLVQKLVPGFEDKKRIDHTVTQVTVGWLDDDDHVPAALDPASHNEEAIH